MLHAMELLDKIRKGLRFLAECLLHRLQWEDMIPYSMVKRLITIAVIGVEENDDNNALEYVKGFKKRE